MFSLMKLTVNNQDIFQTHSLRLYIVQVQGMSISCIHQMPDFHGGGGGRNFAGIRIFSGLRYIAIDLWDDKA
jgi:hypothetical protein